MSLIITQGNSAVTAQALTAQANNATTQGYKLEHCRKYCPKSAQDWTALHSQLNELLDELQLTHFITQRFPHLNHHHLPKIALAGCPNGCSQPQIKDIGISGYLRPELTANPCTGCRRCVASCLENAVTWTDEGLDLDINRCLSCGDCIRACPTGKIACGETGWLLRLGGRLGRHPQLAEILSVEKSSEEVIAKIRMILTDYLENSLPQERLSQFLERRSYSPLLRS